MHGQVVPRIARQHLSDRRAAVRKPDLGPPERHDVIVSHDQAVRPPDRAGPDAAAGPDLHD